MSGLLASVGATVGAATTLGSSLGKLGGDITSVLGFGVQGASFRGIPFVVRESRIRRGRRTALHEYPYSNVVWVEDLGLGTRTISFNGFLVGDNVAQQRDALAAAAETAGGGMLVHPTLGSMVVSLMDFAAAERWDAGRVVEIELSFVQTSNAQSPTSVLADLESALGISADSTLSSILKDGAAAFTAGMSVLSTIGAYVALGGQLMEDVQCVVGAVQGISQLVPAWFGLSEKLAPATPTLLAPLPIGLSTVALTEAATAALLAAQLRAVTTVGEAGAALLANPSPTTLPAYPEAIRAAANDPGDAIRILTTLATMTGATSIGATVPGASPMAALCRRVALVSLGRACADWQPTSYDDTVTMRTNICARFDTEIEAAADAGDGQSYLGLRDLRSAIVAQLNTEGADLPHLASFTFRRSLPALTIAYRLYADAARADALIARVQPVHSAFMPVSFQALAT